MADHKKSAGRPGPCGISTNSSHPMQRSVAETTQTRAKDVAITLGMYFEGYNGMDDGYKALQRQQIDPARKIMAYERR